MGGRMGMVDLLLGYGARVDSTDALHDQSALGALQKECSLKSLESYLRGALE